MDLWISELRASPEWENRLEAQQQLLKVVYNMGQQTGLWDTIMRTDTELITKKELTKNAKKGYWPHPTENFHLVISGNCEIVNL